MWFQSTLPNITNIGIQYNSAAALIAATSDSINNAAEKFHYYKLSNYYNQTSNLAELQDINATYGSTEWNSSASEILEKIKFEVQTFIFENFQAEGPKEIEEISDPREKVNLFNESFQVVTEYFYIGAGGLLIMLAVMNWFGKTKLRKDEWLSIAVRLVIGIGLPFVSIVAFTERQNDTSGFRYQQADWLVPIVMFAFLGVLLADNWIKIVTSAGKRHRRHGSVAIVAGAESAYRADLEMQQRKSKQVQFTEEECLGHQRSESDATPKEVRTDDSGVTRGYTRLDRRDFPYNHDARQSLQHQ